MHTVRLSRRHHRAIEILSCVAATTALGMTAALHADDPMPSVVYDPYAETGVNIDFAVGGHHDFRRSLDDGGSIAVTRAGIDTSLKLDLAEPLSLALSIGYRYESYDFDGAPFPAVTSTLDPWDDVNTLSFGGVLTYRINDQWSVSGGGFGMFAAERDASWSDAFSGGGLVSVAYRMGDRGVIGGGVGITSAIEDSAKLFPVFVLDVPITETLRMTTLRVPSPIYRTGIELVYDVAPTFELAVGTRSERRRFRLNDAGAVPDGVGEELDLPIWLRCSWTPSPSTRLDLMVGVVAWREYRIADRDGLRIDTDRGDPALTVGAAFRATF